MQTDSQPHTILRALGDPTRRAVYDRLVRKSATVSDLTANFKVSQPAISQHLKTLREAGLVDVRREGREAHYRAAADGLRPLTNWIKHYEDFWKTRDGKLRAVLEDLE